MGNAWDVTLKRVLGFPVCVSMFDEEEFDRMQLFN